MPKTIEDFRGTLDSRDVEYLQSEGLALMEAFTRVSDGHLSSITFDVDDADGNLVARYSCRRPTFPGCGLAGGRDE